jgi:hypothetical protein
MMRFRREARDGGDHGLQYGSAAFQRRLACASHLRRNILTAIGPRRCAPQWLRALARGCATVYDASNRQTLAGAVGLKTESFSRFCTHGISWRLMPQSTLVVRALSTPLPTISHRSRVVVAIFERL